MSAVAEQGFSRTGQFGFDSSDRACMCQVHTHDFHVVG